MHAANNRHLRLHTTLLTSPIKALGCTRTTPAHTATRILTANCGSSPCVFAAALFRLQIVLSNRLPAKSAALLLVFECSWAGPRGCRVRRATTMQAANDRRLRHHAATLLASLIEALGSTRNTSADTATRILTANCGSAPRAFAAALLHFRIVLFFNRLPA